MNICVATGGNSPIPPRGYLDAESFIDATNAARDAELPLGFRRD